MTYTPVEVIRLDQQLEVADVECLSQLRANRIQELGSVREMDQDDLFRLFAE